MHVGIIGLGTWLPSTTMSAAEIASATGIPEQVIAEKYGGQIIAGEHHRLGDIEGGHHRAAHGFHVEAPGPVGADLMRDMEAGEPAGVILVLGAAPDHEVELRSLYTRVLQSLSRSLDAHFRRRVLGSGYRLALYAEFFRYHPFGEPCSRGQGRGVHPRGREVDSHTENAYMHRDLIEV